MPRVYLSFAACLAALLVMSAQAQAQICFPTCTTPPAGTPVVVQAGTDSLVTATATGNVTVNLTSATRTALGILNNPSSAITPGGVSLTTLTPNNITLTGSTSSGTASADAAAVRLVSNGANGSDGKPGTNGQPGGPITANINITTISLPSTANNTATASALYGLFGQSIGGNGGSSTKGHNDGGAGGAAGSITAALTQSTFSLSSAASMPAAAIAFEQVGGTGGHVQDSSTAGAGGSTAAANVTVTGGSTSASGTNASAIIVRQTGGNGGYGESGNNKSNAGDGGGTGGITVSLFGNPTTPIPTFSTNGSGAPAVLATATGGTGGTGAQTGNYFDFGEQGGNGGRGGTAGAVLIQAAGAEPITTAGSNSPGLVATSTGGAGSKSGDTFSSTGDQPGPAGPGGAGGDVRVNIASGTTIQTAGSNSSGIVAQSFGGRGGTPGDVNTVAHNAHGVDGATGGASGLATVVTTSGTLISTTGDQSHGILAQSFSGAGGGAGAAISTFADASAGKGGTGGATAGVSVNTDGSITTAGASARGILAQTLSGTGGTGGYSSSITDSNGGTGGASGVVGGVTIVNSGSIITTGAGSQAILAQSIGGGGGTGGRSGGAIYTVGGSGNTDAANSNGGFVTLTNTGIVQTKGDTAAAILLQSIGGGGGDGGSSGGLIVTIGGTGSGGGAGGPVTVMPGSGGGSITTAGGLSYGLVAQSIGGGGGNGGNSTGQSVGIAVAVGGSAGAGGAGGTVNVNPLNLAITTTGTGSAAIVAQSIGGGGGTGGAGYSVSASALASFAVSVGGTGGGGGAAGSSTVTADAVTITTGKPAAATAAPPVDSIGIVAQSIGGGGGAGGGASAAAIAISLPGDTPVSNVAVSGAIAVGGSGATAGPGGPVQVNLKNGSSIATTGAGSLGILAQSIGGGGGQGGDSSALAATIGYAPSRFTPDDYATENVQVTVGVGGKGGAGGTGGTAGITLGTGSGTRVAITTSGDAADGLVLQSIGGGGGNAGVGSTMLTSAGKTSDTKSLKLTVGATGGLGGAGGSSTAVLNTDSAIRTTGSGAIGALVQSIGGGGGTSTGGALNISGLKDIQVTSKVSVNAIPNISLGSTGGAGGAGGAATLTANASVTTIGNDAPAILVQSIGGGGGVGGAAGNDTAASGDATEPSASLPPITRGTGSTLTGGVDLKVESSVSLGASGGTAGPAGAVTVTAKGTTITSGDYSPGIIAQSIGGGGGRGGTATSGAEDTTLKSIIGSASITDTLSLGRAGGGGSAGDGNQVLVNLTGGSITTGLAGQGSAGRGFQSYGLLAQSIGGGGGIASDGTPEPNGLLNLGLSLSAGGGSGGNGGPVTLQTPASTTISTSGDAAHGVVLQSIGAGGGTGGAGSQIAIGTIYYASAFTIALGTDGASGAGGAVQASSTPSIATTGNGAFGLLAQSIGGGGGLAHVEGTQGAPVSRIGGGNGTGGNVGVSLNYGVPITTKGAGSHGVVAQSIGGGGGLESVPPSSSAVPVLSTSSLNLPTNTANNAGAGNGGSVVVSSSAPITTTGNGAFGIIAQSVGGGGGIATNGNIVFAGSSNATNSGWIGGPVSVNVTLGTISTAGANAVGIFAQSAAAGSARSNQVQVVLNGATVQGGSGAQGAGIWIDGGQSASGTFGNQVMIDSTSSVSARSGQAITYSGTQSLDVYNSGTITGSITTGSGGTVHNDGTLIPAGQSVIAGNLQLTANSRIVTTADFASATASSYAVQGNAALGGQVRVNLASILANVRVPVLTVTGTTTGALTASRSALFDYALLPTATATGQRIDLVATGSHFADTSFALSPGRGALARALDRAFLSGAPAFAGYFAQLDTAAATQPAEYARQLGQLSPRGALTVGARRAADASSIANAAMSCPVFAGTSPADAAFLTEGPCAYFRNGGRTSSEAGDLDSGHLNLDNFTTQIGGQMRIADGLYLGGALAYEQSWLNADDGLKGTGHSGQAAVTVKWQTGPFLLTGAAFGTIGSFDLQRTVSVPGATGVAKGSPGNDSAGLRIRAAYTLGTENFYLRPYLNIDGIYAHSGAYREYGVGNFGLAYDGASQTTAVFTPAAEIGARIVLGPALVLRSYVSAGASIRTNDTWKAGAHLVGLTADNGGFTTTTLQDRTTARIGAGVQLFAGDHIDLRAQYDGEFGGRTTTNGGALTAAWRW